MSDSERVLERLIAAEVFEDVLHARYPGTKRFSLEGATALIPLLDEILTSSAAAGAIEIMLGMSHRGRLNVIAHIVGRDPADIFAGFEDTDPRSVLGGGDVKYHLGASGTYHTRDGKSLAVQLVSNPSHLEAVYPVVLGRARARQIRLEDHDYTRVVPVVLHGDGAFAGQGIVAETLNLADLDGFVVGGTIHVVVNNLIGFTTDPPSSIPHGLRLMWRSGCRFRFFTSTERTSRLSSAPDNSRQTTAARSRATWSWI